MLCLGVIMLLVVFAHSSEPEETPEAFFYEKGFIAPADFMMNKMNARFDRPPGVTGNITFEDRFSSTGIMAFINYVNITEVGTPQNAVATIISGGVNSGHVKIQYTAVEGAGFNFEVQVWGFIYWY